MRKGVQVCDSNIVYYSMTILVKFYFVPTKLMLGNEFTLHFIAPTIVKHLLNYPFSIKIRN